MRGKFASFHPQSGNSLTVPWVKWNVDGRLRIGSDCVGSKIKRNDYQILMTTKCSRIIVIGRGMAARSEPNVIHNNNLKHEHHFFSGWNNTNRDEYWMNNLYIVSTAQSRICKFGKRKCAHHDLNRILWIIVLHGYGLKIVFLAMASIDLKSFSCYILCFFFFFVWS